MKSIDIFSYLNILHSPSPFPQVPPHTHTIPVLQSCLSLLIFKYMFKRVSQCIPTMSIPYFGPFNPFHCSPLPLYFRPLIFNSFQYLSLYPLPSQMLCFSVLLILILFSFPSFPKSHRVVPLLQTCSTYEFIYAHICFCGYVYLLGLSSMYNRKHTDFVFLSLAYFTQHDVLQLHPFTLKTLVIIPYD
jgi:hypothetical protein